MTFTELKEALRERPEDVEQKLYNYGYSCGERDVINFEIVQQVFYIFNYEEAERRCYMRKIIKGFKDGSRAVR